MRGLPDLSSDAGATGNVINDDYNWDENGNVLRIINGIAGANSTRTMTYDARDRLASTTFDDIAAPVCVFRSSRATIPEDAGPPFRFMPGR